MSKEHTEGPWQCKHIAGSNFAVQAFDIRASGYPIFNKDRHAIDGAHVYCSPANARLIAAAPELLEALKEMVRMAENEGWEGFEKARALIAKASPATTDAGVAG